MKPLSGRINLGKTLPYLLVICGPLLLLAYPLLSGKSLFWGTPALQFIPWRAYAFQQILNGQMPFLNPFVGLNAPLIANYQVALFYPFTWLLLPFYALGGTPWLAWAHGLYVLVHLVLAGVGMARLVKQWGANIAGMITAGLAFSLSAYWVTRMGFFSIICSGAWLPWEFYYLNRLMDDIEGHKNARFAFAALSFCAAMQLLAGHAQTTWYTFVLLVIWTWVRLFQRRNLITVLKNFVLALLPLALGALIACVQLLPTAEYLLLSQRAASVDYTKALSYSFWPWHFINFIAPDFFGTPVQGNYWGYLSYWEDAVYIGLFPLIAALMTLFLPGLLRENSRNGDDDKILRKWVLMGWCTITAAALLALGYNTPLYPFLYRYVPTFAMFNAPARLMVVTVFFLSAFAGIGISRWQKPRGRQKKYMEYVAVAGIAVSLGAWLAQYFVDGINRSVFQPVGLLGILVFVSALFLRNGNPADYQKGGRQTLLLFAFVLLDLLIADIAFNPYVDKSFYQAEAPTVQDLQMQGRVFIDQANEYALKFRKYLRFNDFAPPGNWEKMKSSMLPNINMLNGIYSASNFDPLLYGRYQNWLDHYVLADQNQKKTMLTLMDVHTLLLTDIRGQDNGVVKMALDGGSPLGQADCALTAANESEALEKTLNNRAAGQVVVETRESLPDCVPDIRGENVLITMLTAQRVEVESRAETDGWIWLSYLNYPGWQVRIDGQPGEVLAINYLFLGVHVPAGQHNIVFEYFPGSFYAGLLLSCMGLLIWVGILLLKRNG